MHWRCKTMHLLIIALGIAVFGRDATGQTTDKKKFSAAIVLSTVKSADCRIVTIASINLQAMAPRLMSLGLTQTEITNILASARNLASKLCSNPLLSFGEDVESRTYNSVLSAAIDRIVRTKGIPKKNVIDELVLGTSALQQRLPNECRRLEAGKLLSMSDDAFTSMTARLASGTCLGGGQGNLTTSERAASLAFQQCTQQALEQTRPELGCGEGGSTRPRLNGWRTQGQALPFDGQVNNAEEAQKQADAAKAAADTAQKAADKAKVKAEQAKKDGDPNADTLEVLADHAQRSASNAADAAKRAQNAATNAKNAEDSGDIDGAKNAAQDAKQAADSAYDDAAKAISSSRAIDAAVDGDTDAFRQAVGDAGGGALVGLGTALLTDGIQSASPMEAVVGALLIGAGGVVVALSHFLDCQMGMSSIDGLYGVYNLGDRKSPQPVVFSTAINQCSCSVYRKSLLGSCETREEKKKRIACQMMEFDKNDARKQQCLSTLLVDTEAYKANQQCLVMGRVARVNCPSNAPYMMRTGNSCVCTPPNVAVAPINKGMCYHLNCGDDSFCSCEGPSCTCASSGSALVEPVRIKGVPQIDILDFFDRLKNPGCSNSGKCFPGGGGLPTSK